MSGNTTFVLGQKGVEDSVQIGNRCGGFSANLRYAQAASNTPAVATTEMHEMVAPLPQQPWRAPSKPVNAPPPNRAPSVTFSELDMFANPAKLKAPNELKDDDDEYEYYYEDEEDDDDDTTGQFANAVGGTQEDTKYGFMKQAASRDTWGTPTTTSHQHKAPTTTNAPHSSAAPGGGHYYSLQPETGTSTSKRLSSSEVGDTKTQLRERVKLIAKLKRRNAKRTDADKIHIDENAHLDTLRRQTQCASYETKARLSVLMMRRITMFMSKLIEEISKRYPNYMGDLEGWSESIYLSLDQYDDLLYDIYDEYGDQFQGNPIVMYMLTLGTNAVMYTMAKKITNNPVAGQMMRNLHEMLNKATKGAAVGNGRAQTHTDVVVPPLSDGPTVPLSTGASVDSDAANPMAGLLSMFGSMGSPGGGGGDGMLAGLDMNQLLSGIGDLMGGTANHRTGDCEGDFRGEALPDDHNTAKVQVNQMSGVSEEDSKQVLDMLRKQEDQSMVAVTTANNSTMARTPHIEVEGKYDGYHKGNGSRAVDLQPPPLTRTTRSTSSAAATAAPARRSGSRLSFEPNNTRGS